MAVSEGCATLASGRETLFFRFLFLFTPAGRAMVARGGLAPLVRGRESLFSSLFFFTPAG
jgi:hypothetical protein